MKKAHAIWEKDGYILRPAQKEDAESYYQNNYNPLDPEVARLTGCKPSFTHDEVVNFFLSCINDEERKFPHWKFLCCCQPFPFSSLSSLSVNVLSSISKNHLYPALIS